LFNWTVENLDNLAIGKFFGAQALGLYSISYNLTRTPANHIVASLQAALFPASARMQDDVENLRRGYLAVVSAISLVAIPVFLSMAAVSYTLVLALFGDKWQGAEAVVAPLALAMIFHVIMAVSGPILAGKGNPEIEFRVQLWTGVLFVGLLIWASRSSVIVIAWGVLAIYMVRMVWMTTALLQLLKISLCQLILVLIGPIFLGIAIAVALKSVDSVFQDVAQFPRLMFEFGLAIPLLILLILFIPSFFIAPELRLIIVKITNQRPALRSWKAVQRVVGS
jgi:O-antigen/teichoic acid export membrane protein